MKFAMFGAGGTGGVLGGYLALAGHDVTLIARGRHLEALQKDGLTIETAHRGVLHIKNVKAETAELYSETPDVLFVCCKYYGLADAIAFAKRVASEDTLIVPILNVFGTGEVMQKELPGLTVLDGCIYIFGNLKAPGVLEQPQKILRVIFGFRPGQDKRLEEKAKALEKLLQDADIRGHYSLDIRRDALTKFGFVSPMGAAGLYHNVTSEAFQKEGAVRETFIGLIREVEALGKAMGIVFEKDLQESGIALIDAFKPGLKTSMQRDVEKGGASEFEGLVNSVVALGERYGVPVPLYKKISDWGREKGIR
ncbi:2-dehydropantoate 2-reductase [uncultured Selenomonas sp.]|uniref:ketopantoate reductase family protein n=1 Tax=uncultured Selenomonas sp. TaxID=159275 RepID=UPI0028DB930A|nr:2-dehydropantoate 2-reductase [uncultured Selenomonas sp.]